MSSNRIRLRLIFAVIISAAAAAAAAPRLSARPAPDISRPAGIQAVAVSGRPDMIHVTAFQPGEFQPAAGPERIVPERIGTDLTGTDLTAAGAAGRAPVTSAGTGGYTGLTLDAVSLTGASARPIARRHGPARGLAFHRRPGRHRPARHQPGRHRPGHPGPASHRAGHRAAHRHHPAARRAPRGPLAPRQIARLLLPSYHWAQWQFRYLSMLWMRESGWDPHALNPGSGAYGIPQAVPGAKMASAGPDWRWNPRTQIRWGLTYIAGRYGSPLNAWQHESGYGWY